MDNKYRLQPLSLALAGLIGSTMAIATVVGDFLTMTVPVPMAILLFFGILVILPTGDLIRLITLMLENISLKHKSEQRKRDKRKQAEDRNKNQ